MPDIVGVRRGRIWSGGQGFKPGFSHRVREAFGKALIEGGRRQFRSCERVALHQRNAEFLAQINLPNFLKPFENGLDSIIQHLPDDADRRLLYAGWHA